MRETGSALTDQPLPPFPDEEKWTEEALAASQQMTAEEKAELLGMLQEPPWEPTPVADRLRDGQLLFDPNGGPELLETFMGLSDEEQEKFWGNVQEEIEYEKWVVGDRDDPPGPPKTNRKPPTMRPPSPSPALSLEETLSRLERVRRMGNQWKALCPAHEDRNNPSLIISENSYKPGEPRFFCYVGCTHQQVKDAVMQL